MVLETWAIGTCHPLEKLVYTSTFFDEHANPLRGTPEHLTTVIFTEEAHKTHASARIQFVSAAERKIVVRMGMNMTWNDLIG